MVGISEIKIGMMVKIVDEWGGGCAENGVGLMDRYLGRTVCVSAIDGEWFHIEQDGDDVDAYIYCGNVGWFFNRNCIDYIVDDDISSVSEDDILQLL